MLKEPDAMMGLLWICVYCCLSIVVADVIVIIVVVVVVIVVATAYASSHAEVHRGTPSHIQALQGNTPTMVAITSQQQ